MKKYLFFIIFFIEGYSVHAYNFSAVSPSGQVLYYNIISNNEVQVTFPRSYSDYSSTYVEYYWGFERPIGNLTIPDSVNYSGITYSITSIGANAFFDCVDLTEVIIPNSVITI